MDSKAKALDDLMRKAAQQRKESGPLQPRNAAKEARQALAAARGEAEAKGKLAGFFPPKAISKPKREASEGDKGAGFRGAQSRKPQTQDETRAREDAGDRPNRPQPSFSQGLSGAEKASAAGLDGFFPASALASPKPPSERGQRSGANPPSRGGERAGGGKGGYGAKSGSGGRGGYGARGQGGAGRSGGGDGSPGYGSHGEHDAYDQDYSERELEQYGHNRHRDLSELTREEQEALLAGEAPPKPPISPEALPQLNASKDLLSSFLKQNPPLSPTAANASEAAAPTPQKSAVAQKTGSAAPPELDAGKNLLAEFLRKQQEAEELTPEEKITAILSAAPRADENAKVTGRHQPRSDHADDLLGEKTQWLRSGQSGAEPGADGAPTDPDAEFEASARSARKTRREEERARNKRNKAVLKEAEESGETVRTSQIERQGPAVRPPLAPKDALAAARRKGVDLLSRTDLSAQELIKRISRDERLAPYAAQAVEQLQALGLQSDERYAIGRARMRMYTRSKKFIERELADQGMPPELIAKAVEQALESHHVESDTDLLAQALARRFGPREPAFGAARDKQARWFVSRGYGFDQIKAVWAMARQGLLDQWASADYSPEEAEAQEAAAKEKTDQERAARSNGRGAYGSKKDDASTDGEGSVAGAGQKGKKPGKKHPARGSLDAAALAELAQARERKFGEDAPLEQNKKQQEIRWLSIRGATMDQIKEMWADAKNNAEVRLQANPPAEAEPESSDDAMLDPDMDSGWSRSSFGRKRANAASAQPATLSPADSDSDSEGSSGSGHSLSSGVSSTGAFANSDFKDIPDENAPDAFELAWLKKYKGAAPANGKEKTRQAGWAARHGGSFSQVAALWERAKNGDFD